MEKSIDYFELNVVKSTYVYYNELKRECQPEVLAMKSLKANLHGILKGAFEVLALCLMMLCFLVGCTDMSDQTKADENEVIVEDSTAELAIQEGPVAIYYLDGDTILSEEQHLPYQGSDVFEAWKGKNGLGPEVELLNINIEDNGEESTYEFEGETVVSYKVGDYFVFNMTISDEIVPYFETMDRELLSQSLEQTFLGYSMIDYDEFHIIIE